MQTQNIDSLDQMWFMELSQYTILHTKNNLCIQKKGDVTYFEDDFIYPELRLLKKYILPTENCLVLSIGSLSGTLFQFCKSITVLTANNQEYMETKDRFAQCFPSNSYSIYCTNIRPELYPQEYVSSLLTIHHSKYDNIIVLIKKSPMLLKYVQPLMKRTSKVFLRRYNTPDVRIDMTKNTGLQVIEKAKPLIAMEGPHYPDLGFAVLQLI